MKYKIQYINLCIVGFAKKYHLSIPMSCHYLKKFMGLDFLDKNYEAEHVLPLDETIKSIHTICRLNGGTI